MGPFSVDFFRKNNLSASWRIGHETTADNAISAEVSISLTMYLTFLLPMEKMNYYSKYPESFIYHFGNSKIAGVASKMKHETSRDKEEHSSNGNVFLEIPWIGYLTLTMNI